MPRMTLTKINQIANKVLKSKFESLNEAEIEDTMTKLVDGQQRKIIFDSLGLQKTWSGELEIRYNGSFARVLKILARENIDRLAKVFLVNLFYDAPTPEFNEKEKASLRKKYKDTYFEEVESYLINLAKDAALVDSPMLFADFMHSQEESTVAKE